METTSSPSLRRLRQVAADGSWWILMLVSGALFVLLAFEAAAWFLWVAHSAFLGIRDDPEPLLGLFCVTAAAAPIAAAGGAWWASGRQPRWWLHRLCIAFGVGLPVVLLTVVIAAFMMGPF